jgi:hypothetical protein
VDEPRINSQFQGKNFLGKAPDKAILSVLLRCKVLKYQAKLSVRQTETLPGIRETTIFDMSMAGPRIRHPANARRAPAGKRGS